jgi:hypothetical protein
MSFTFHFFLVLDFPLVVREILVGLMTVTFRETFGLLIPLDPIGPHSEVVTARPVTILPTNLLFAIIYVFSLSPEVARELGL